MKLISFIVVGSLIYCVSSDKDPSYSRVERQVPTGTGLTFAFPALNLFGGGIGNNNNLFGEKTFTRTVISTVATITTLSYRTCTNTMALTPCRRRRRSLLANQEDNYQLQEDIEIDPTASMILIVDSTTISNPIAITEYLSAHKPSDKSIIYPGDIALPEPQEYVPEFDATTTQLYSSIEPDEDGVQADFNPILDETTELQNSEFSAQSDEIAEGTTAETPEEEFGDRGRVGLGNTVTITTTIPVTSVATRIATTGTLSVVYQGCSQVSLPVSGLACV